MSHAGFIVHPTYRLRDGPRGRAALRAARERRAVPGRGHALPPVLLHAPRVDALARGASATSRSSRPSSSTSPARRVVRVIAPVPPAVPRLREKLEAARREGARGRHPLPVPVSDRPRAARRGRDPGRAGSGRRRARALPRSRSSRPGAAVPELRVAVARSRDHAGRERASCRSRCTAPASTRSTSYSDSAVAGARDSPRRGVAPARRSPSASARSTPTCSPAGTWSSSTSTCSWRAPARSAYRSSSAARRGRVALAQDASFTRQRRAEIPGRIVLDGIALVRDAFIPLEDFSLETAARALLGRGKRIAASGRARVAEILRLYGEDPRGPGRLQPRGRASWCSTSSPRSHCSSWRSSAACSRACSSTAWARASRPSTSLYLPELRRRGRVAPSVNRERELGARLGRRGHGLAPRRVPKRRRVRLQEPVSEPDAHLQPRSARARRRRAPTRARSRRRTARVSRAASRSCPRCWRASPSAVSRPSAARQPPRRPRASRS